MPEVFISGSKVKMFHLGIVLEASEKKPRFPIIFISNKITWINLSNITALKKYFQRYCYLSNLSVCILLSNENWKVSSVNDLHSPKLFPRKHDRQWQSIGGWQNTRPCFSLFPQKELENQTKEETCFIIYLFNCKASTSVFSPSELVPP